MKKVLPLVLLPVIFAVPVLFSEDRDCLRSFDLGWNTAEELHRSRGWYWIGLAAGLSALGVYAAVDSYIWNQGGGYDPLSGEEPATGPLPFVCAVSVLAAPLLPAFLLPRRTKILPPDDMSNPECYREGFTKRAHRKNARALLYGELTAGGFVLLGSILFAAAYAGDF